ncbi:hypothetical protein AB0420_18360 [Streptomyces caelestis]|uniref:hypothetical protein n=1 Tax=Streptomyces caelestis TaxID=36816 RepID=UPI00344E4D7B
MAGAAADVVFAGEAGDGPAAQVRGAHVFESVGRDGGAAPALAALGLGGADSGGAGHADDFEYSTP